MFDSEHAVAQRPPRSVAVEGVGAVWDSYRPVWFPEGEGLHQGLGYVINGRQRSLKGGGLFSG